MTNFDFVTALVASELFGTPFSFQSRPDWGAVLSCAHENGVVAICYETIKRLPPDVQPDFVTMLSWDVSSEEVVSGFQRRSLVKEHLRDLFSSIGERMLLLKGESLADYYPHPQMRESGDIDIMLLDGYDRGNAFLESLGFVLDYSNTKHSQFIYEGVDVENHDPAPHVEYNRNDYLTECIVSASLEQAVLRPDGCWELPPVIMAVHTVNHIALHLYLGERVPLKMLADIALLFKAHPEIIREWTQYLSQARLTEFAGTVLRAIDSLFGTSLSDGGECSDFIELFVRREGSRLSQIIGKYRYLPRSFGETLHEVSAKFLRKMKFFCSLEKKQ